MRVKVRFRTKGASDTICSLSRTVPIISSTAIHYSTIVSVESQSRAKETNDRNRNMDPVVCVSSLYLAQFLRQKKQ